jgi:hypothetical protein
MYQHAAIKRLSSGWTVVKEQPFESTTRLLTEGFLAVSFKIIDSLVKSVVELTRTIVRTFVRSIFPFIRHVVSRDYVLMAGAGYITYCGVDKVVTWLRRRYANYLHAHLLRPPERTKEIRRAFEEAALQQVYVGHAYGERHPHPHSAAERTVLTNMAESLCVDLALRPYYYQMSSRDAHGYRTPYWPRDVLLQPRVEPPQDDDAIIVVDTDYYLDMPRFMVDYSDHVLILITKIPPKACDDGETTYTFTERGLYRSCATGNRPFQDHPLWDWNTEWAEVWSFINLTRVDYQVYRKTLPNSPSAIVILIPYSRYTGIDVFLAQLLVPMKDPLVWFNPVHKGFIRIARHTKSGTHVSTAKAGTYVSVELTIKDDDALWLKQKNIPAKLTHATICKFLRDNEVVAQIYCAYFAAVDSSWSARVDTNEPNVFGYVQKLDHYDQGFKTSTEPYMAPIYDGVVTPLACIGSEKQAALMRVTRIQDKIQYLPVTNSLYQSWGDEFITIIHGLIGNLHPVSFNTVRLNQPRPEQRRILDIAVEQKRAQALDWEASTFVKAETYAAKLTNIAQQRYGVNDPRIITTVGGVFKLYYSTFCYAICHALVAADVKQYAFGFKPKEVALRVGTIAARADSMVETDYSRFDGHVSRNVRRWEAKLLQTLFPQYREFVTKLHASQVDKLAKTRRGYHYETGTSRLSGSPETSIMNTLVNMLIAYCTTRRDYPELTPIEIFDKLGIFGGDDGLTGDVTEESLLKAATAWGQKVTYVLKQRGDCLAFLARIYGNVWYYDGDERDVSSMQDPRRALSKLHVSVRNHLHPFAKLTLRMAAYSLTDMNTPLLGKLASVVLDRARELPQYVPFTETVNYPYLAPWLARWGPNLDSQYPNEYQEWMNQVVLQQLNDFDFDKYNGWLDNCPHGLPAVEYLLKPPICHPPLKIDDAIINGVNLLRKKNKKRRGNRRN